MWNSIKKILQKQKGTCIIVEDGKPAYVVMSFEDFEKSTGEMEAKENLSGKIVPSATEQELLERINQEITAWKGAQEAEQAAESLEAEEGEVKIEDLPV